MAFWRCHCDQSQRNGKPSWLSQVPPNCQPFKLGRRQPFFPALLPALQYLRFQMLLRESHHLFVSHLGEKGCVFVETEALQPRGNICGEAPRSQDSCPQSPVSWRRPPVKHAAGLQRTATRSPPSKRSSRRHFWGEVRNDDGVSQCCFEGRACSRSTKSPSWGYKSPPPTSSQSRCNVRDSQIEANKATSSSKCISGCPLSN